MGTITRHAGAPFASGETSSAADLEADISTFYKEFNGKVSSANVLSTANINGSKLQLSSIAEAKIALTTNRISPKQIARMAYVQSDATEDTSTTSTLLVDVPSIQAIIVNPYTQNDIILMRFQATLNGGPYGWAFAVNGSDTNIVGTSLGDATDTINGHATASVMWVQRVPGVSAIQIKPRYLALSGGGHAFVSKVFTVLLLPG